MAIYRDLIVAPSATLRDSLVALTENRMKIVLVADERDRLLGTIVDGDVRRALLRNPDLGQSVTSFMNNRPLVGRRSMPPAVMHDLMRRNNLSHIPILDDDGVLVDIRLLNAPARQGLASTSVVLMAGGEGQRLRPLTQHTPKPMLELGGKPILEHIINRLTAQGFSRFYISLNYLGHVIQDYFGDGGIQDASIYYLHEEKKLGTGGALGLLPEIDSDPLIVMNGDVLTDLDFADLVQTHLEGDFTATMCTREFMTTLQFGVVEANGDAFLDIVEKPSLTHKVNAGVYCISNKVLSMLEPNTHYDMPDIFKLIRKNGGKCGVHPVKGQWIDIGTRQEFERADALFK